MAKDSSSTETKGRGKMKIKYFVMALIIVGLAVGGGYYYNKYQDTKKEVTKLSNPQEAAKAQVAEVVANIGKLVELPKGETPTLATVVDPAKLKDQTFFATSQKGDQVLIYTQAKKAYLYRPSTNKILEIAPVNIGASSQTTNNTGQ